MKIYQADSELEKILLENGFKEFTPAYDVKKGKKSFKLSRNSSQTVKFDYINIQIHTTKGRDRRIQLNQKELCLILLCFKLSYLDIKEVLPNASFSLNAIEKRLKILQQELSGYKEFGINNGRRRRLTRIIDSFEMLNLKLQSEIQY